MKRKTRFASVLVILLVCAALLTIFLPHRPVHTGHSPLGTPFSGRQLRCALNIGRFDDSTRILITGYNYALL